MPAHRVRRLASRQDGSSLIELLVAMPLAILLLFVVLQALENAGSNQQDIERRTSALSQAQVGLERITQDLRQADWVYFRTSSVVDMQTPVRTGSGNSTSMLVRYDCSGTVCARSVGSPVMYPPPASPAFIRTGEVVIGSDASDIQDRSGQIMSHDIFRPARLDPDTGITNTDVVQPNYVYVTVRLRVRGRPEPAVLSDGVAIRNQASTS